MKRFILIAVTSLLLMLPVAGSAFATAPPAANCGNSTYDPLTCACKTGGQAIDSTACSPQSTDNPIAGPHGVLKKVTLIMASIAGVAAVIVIIIGGFQYVTSGGDPQKASSARNMIVGALVGLVIIAAAEGILTFVISKL